MTKSGTSKIAVEALAKRFAGVFAVEDMSFTVGAGEIFGLAGAVGADKAEDLAGPDRETHVLDGEDAGETLGKSFDGDFGGAGLRHGCGSSIAASAGMPGTSSCVGLSMSILMR